jgi:hypothetical protein
LTEAISPRNVAPGPDAPDAETPVITESPTSCGEPVIVPCKSGFTCVFQSSEPSDVLSPIRNGCLFVPKTTTLPSTAGLVRA